MDNPLQIEGSWNYEYNHKVMILLPKNTSGNNDFHRQKIHIRRIFVTSLVHKPSTDG